MDLIDVKRIKKEEPVEYFLISSTSDRNFDVAIDAYPNDENSVESAVIQEVKQEYCEDIQPIFDEYGERAVFNPLEFLKESGKETSEYEPDTNENDDVEKETSEYEPDSTEDGSVNNDTDDEDWSAEEKIKKRKKLFVNRLISLIQEVDEDAAVEGPPYACNVCSLTFPIEKSLRAHRSIHNGQKFRCEVCKKGFKDSWHIHQHIKTHTEPYEPKFSCPICFKRFTLEKTLTRHKIHHQDKEFECDYCKKQFRQKCHLIQHMKIHRKRIKRFQCEICDMAYYEQRTLNRHMKHIHSNFVRQRFRCPNTLCDKSYTTVSAFRMHACVDGRRPVEMLLVRCSLCDKRFGDKFELRRHTKRTHETTRPDNYLCTTCGTTFLYSSFHSFVLHVAQNCARKFTYHCDLCKSVLRSKTALLQHFLRKHRIACSAAKNGHFCPHCNKVFSTGGYLNQHMKKRHSDPSCVYCNKTFRSKAGYKKHQNCCMPKKTFDKYSKHAATVAIGDAPKTDSFTCEICKFSFITETNLLEHHTLVHLEKRFVLDLQVKDTPFKCETCGQSFNNRFTLSKHRIRVHKNKKTFKCLSCKEKFVGEEVYHEHLAISECGRKQMQRYQCTVCAKIYASNIRLRLHFEKVHTKAAK